MQNNQGKKENTNIQTKKKTRVNKINKLINCINDGANMMAIYN